MLIVALTANALPQDEARCLEAGMDAYLRKPIDLVALEACLAGLLGVDASSRIQSLANGGLAAPEVPSET